MAQVVNVKTDGELIEQARREGRFVPVHRPFLFGNPFVIGKDGTREEVIEKYRGYVLGSPELLEKLPLLRGMVLGCYCAPLSCHAGVLVEMVKELEGKDFA